MCGRGKQFCFLGDLKIQVFGAEIWEHSAFVPQHPRGAPQEPDRSPPVHIALPGTKTVHLLPPEATALIHVHTSWGPEPASLGLACMMVVSEICSSLSLQGAEGCSAELAIKASTLLSTPEEICSCNV